jgi:tetratricopeptide (TPR) repeat protein
MKAWHLVAALGAWALVAAAGASAQQRFPLRTTGPLLIASQSDYAPSQKPIPSLPPPQLERLRRAQSFREGRLYDRAREILVALNAEVPHHALILTELARVHLAKRDPAAVERLGRAERASQADSLLLSRELTQAYEQLRRPRDAAQVVLEAWTAVPTEAQWATSTILHLASIDPKAIRDLMQRFADRAPQRFDMLQGLAQLQWQMGDAKTALRILTAADRTSRDAAQRIAFAGELLDRGVARDTTGALTALLDVAGDGSLDDGLRAAAAHRAWQIYLVHLAESDGAPLVARALQDLPSSRWPAEMLGGVVRGLRQAGQTAQARALLKTRGPENELPPELALEHALADLRDGPPERALPSLRRTVEGTPEGAYFYAEALFYAGLSDSALGYFKTIAEDPHGPYAGAALERIYLIEDARTLPGLATFGRIAYETWRGDQKDAELLADSLYRSLPQGPLWAQAALELAARREALGNAKGALEPLLLLAESLPDDRLAPRARQRAGDIYLTRIKDEAKAAEQYEECLARYPRAWNAPEIRRQLELLRRERRF